MLTSLSLKNYKCFPVLELPLKPLTILTGLNSSGKSSVLQSFSLLHQSIVNNEKSSALDLNGDFVSLGTVGDVLNELVGGKKFQIGLKSESFECTWEFDAESRKSLYAPIDKLFWRYADRTSDEEFWNSKEYDSSEKFQNFLPGDLDNNPDAQTLVNALRNLQYLCAERVGPRDVYPASNASAFPNVGVHGENTPWVLEQFSDIKPVSELLIAGATQTLQRQVEAWMREFFPGAGLDIMSVPRTNFVNLGLRTSESESFHRPQNVGYGLTHVLPIITACLSGSRNGILLVENPEAHLHPRGQSLMGEFLARVAACGMQIIVETHSDHVLNGARKAVKNKVIKHEQVAIHYFTPKEEARVVSPLIDKNGNLDSWPEGFFDQFDVDTSSLIGWSDQDHVSSK
jgi:predicted ATPase